MADELDSLEVLDNVRIPENAEDTLEWQYEGGSTVCEGTQLVLGAEDNLGVTDNHKQHRDTVQGLHVE